MGPPADVRAVEARATVGFPPSGWVLAPVLICALAALGLALSGADQALFLGANRLAAVLPAGFWAGLTNLGATLAALCLLAPALVWCPRWVASALLAIPLAVLYTQALKWTLAVPRPAAVLDPAEFHVIGEILKTKAIPSGHALTAFALAGVVILHSSAAMRRRIAGAVLVSATLVGCSRVAVGAHWPLDVLLGALGGWLSAVVGVYWAERAGFWRHPGGIRWMAWLMLACAAALALQNLGYPQGVWAQYLMVAWGAGGALWALRRHGWRR